MPPLSFSIGVFPRKKRKKHNVIKPIIALFFGRGMFHNYVDPDMGPHQKAIPAPEYGH